MGNGSVPPVGVILFCCSMDIIKCHVDVHHLGTILEVAI